VFFQKHRNITHHPPGPKGLPIIGNLHQLDISNLYFQFSQFSKIYGPLFSLQLGFRKAIVVSSAEIAKEVLKNNDHVFSNRPKFYGQQKLTYNGSEMCFSQYGDFWREIRKICVVHIFSAKRVSYYSSIRKFEVKKMIEKISRHATSSSVTNLSELLISLSSTLICRIVFGKSYENEGNEKSRFHEMLHEFQTLLAEVFVSDYIPFMGWIDKLRGLHGRVDKNFKEFDEFFQKIIDEHLDPNREHGADEDVMVDVLLQLKNQHLSSIDLTFDHIKGVLVVRCFNSFFSFNFCVIFLVNSFLLLRL
jgi:cytochrome P450